MFLKSKGFFLKLSLVHGLLSRDIEDPPWGSYKKSMSTVQTRKHKKKIQHVVYNVAVAMVNIHVSREVLKLVSEVKSAAKTHFHK